MNKFVVPFLLIVSFFAVGCSKDEPKDVVEEIKMSVSAETGVRYLPGSELPIECMLVMSEDNPGVWVPLGFDEIRGFTYIRGHEYYLSVERTILANPPMDASNRRYSLLRILDDHIVTKPEIPVDKVINSEKDIVYNDMCPFNKYAISNNFIVNEEGGISYVNGSSVFSYDNARIWLETILDKADPNWIKFNKIPYMAIYSFVLSPLTEEIRLERVNSSRLMFRDVVPENEFAYITQSMKSGEELRYALILANVYKEGLQKVEFTIKKQ